MGRPRKAAKALEQDNEFAEERELRFNETEETFVEEPATGDDEDDEETAEINFDDHRNRSDIDDIYDMDAEFN